jgi:hypothetical protein
MTEQSKEKLAGFAVLALLAISIVTIIGGMIVALNGQEIEGVVAVVTGAVAGIVAIVVRDSNAP